MNTRLLIVGWDGANWEQVHPLLDAGKLPNVLRLVESGGSGTLTGLAPALEPIVWTTLSTGRLAEHHGVLHGWEIRPDKGGVQPAGHRSWRAPSFWDVLSAAGLRTAVVNWPATSPAASWPGIVVDENFPTPSALDFATWPLARHSVSPASWRETMTDLRVHPHEITLSDLIRLVPRAAEIDQKRDRRLGRLSISLARTVSVHAAATYLAETAQWDMLAVRYTLLADSARDVAARSKEGDPDLSLYAGVSERAYRFQDAMVGRLLELAGPNTRVILIAPYTHAARRSSHSDPWPGGDHHHGMILASGPGFVADAILQGATLHDLFPTILRCFGLSAQSDGDALHEILADPQAPVRAISVPQTPPEAAGQDPAASLLALGYTDNLSPEQAAAIAHAQVTAQTNLGESLLARGEWRRAANLFEAVLRRRPDHYDANVKLGHALLQLGDAKNARPVAETVLTKAPNLPWGHLLMGVVLMLEGDFAASLVNFQRARELGRDAPVILMRIAWINLLLNRASDAEAGFRAVLAQQQRSAEALTGLGISLEQQDRPDEAEQALRAAIALEFFNPIAHVHLGQVLARRGLDLEAIKALRHALAEQPDSPDAKALLAALERRVAKTELGAILSRQP